MSLKSCGLEATSKATSSSTLPAMHVAEQRLVEGLHPVVLALGDHLGQPAGLLRVEDQVLDPAGGDQHLADGDPAVAADALGTSRWPTTPAQGRGEHHPRLLLQVRREEVDDPVDGLGRVQGVQGREHEVAGLGGARAPCEPSPRRASRRSGSRRGPGAGPGASRGRSSRCPMPTSRWLMIERLSRCRYSIGSSSVMMLREPGRVDVVDHRRQRRRLARAGGPGEQDDPALLLGQRRGSPAAGRGRRSSGPGTGSRDRRSRPCRAGGRR